MFYQKVIFTALMCFDCNLSKVNSLKCISMNKQECKVRPEIVRNC